METEWKDITTYSQGDKERIPRSYVITLGLVKLVVTRRLHLSGWYADAPPFLAYRALPSDDAETSKKDALSMLIVLLRQAQEQAEAAFKALC